MKIKMNTSTPFELLGYYRKIKSQKKIGQIIYEMYINRRKQGLESQSISRLEEMYKIRSETIWKYLGDKVHRKSFDSVEKCIKLTEEDIETIGSVLDLSRRLETIKPGQARLIKFVYNYLINNDQ